MLGTLQDEDDIADLKELVKKQKEENEQRNRDLQEKVSMRQHHLTEETILCPLLPNIPSLQVLVVKTCSRIHTSSHADPF